MGFVWLPVLGSDPLVVSLYTSGHCFVFVCLFIVFENNAETPGDYILLRGNTFLLAGADGRGNPSSNVGLRCDTVQSLFVLLLLQVRDQ